MLRELLVEELEAGRKRLRLEGCWLLRHRCLMEGAEERSESEMWDGDECGHKEEQQ